MTLRKSLSRIQNTNCSFGEIGVTVSLEQIQLWLEAKEDAPLECKEAKQNFHFETLVRYCVALANEGGDT